MRTITARGLAAGTGAAVLVLAGAVAAHAIPGQPTGEFWEEYYTGLGMAEVACTAVPAPANADLSITVTDAWDAELSEGNEWIGIVLKVAEDYEPQAWTGYGIYSYGGEVPGDAPGNVTHIIMCQAPAEDAEETTDPEQTTDPEETTDPEQTTEPEETTDPAQTTEPEETTSPTGPPVETDGPSSRSANVGLVGGAALALAGAGAAGWAMRRRPDAR